MKEVTQTKFLGVLIDQDLNWKVHLDNLCNRINKFVYALNQIKNVTNRKTAIITYHAYIESILRYGLIIWGNSTDKNRAFIAQKKCIRAICGIRPDESCEPIFKKLGLLPLPSLYIYEICNFVYNNKGLFQKAHEVIPQPRRDPHRLVVKDTPRSDKYAKSCLVMCVRIYNKIPENLKLLNNINLFKNKLYKWLNGHNFYDINDFFSIKN